MPRGLEDTLHTVGRDELFEDVCTYFRMLGASLTFHLAGLTKGCLLEVGGP